MKMKMMGKGFSTQNNWSRPENDPIFNQLLKGISKDRLFQNCETNLKTIVGPVRASKNIKLMGVYLIYIPERGRLIYYGKSYDLETRNSDHQQQILYRGHINTNLQKAFQFYKGLKKEEILGKKVFIIALLESEIDLKTIDPECYKKAKKIVNTAETALERFFDKQKTFTVANIARTKASNKKGTLASNPVYFEVITNSLIQNVKNLMDSKTELVETYDLTTSEVNIITMRLRQIIPIVNMKTGDFYISLNNATLCEKLKSGEIKTAIINDNYTISTRTYCYATGSEIVETKYLDEYNNKYKNFIYLPCQNNEFLSINKTMVGPIDPGDSVTTSPRKVYITKREAANTLERSESTFFSMVEKYKTLNEFYDQKALWRYAILKESRDKKVYDQYEIGLYECVPRSVIMSSFKNFIVRPNFSKDENKDPRVTENLKLYVSLNDTPEITGYGSRYLGKVMNGKVFIDRKPCSQPWSELTKAQKINLYFAAFRPATEEEKKTYKYVP